MDKRIGLSPKRILCVDDDEDALQLLSMLLREYEVVTASSLGEAMRVMENQPFDLYILDNWLGEDSGVELCRYIQTADPNTPVIFCSGVAYEQEQREALQAGAQAYLVKPIDFEKLMAIVKKQLDLAGKIPIEDCSEKEGGLVILRFLDASPVSSLRSPYFKRPALQTTFSR